LLVPIQIPRHRAEVLGNDDHEKLWKTDIILFEGWFVGVRPKSTQLPSTRCAATDSYQ